MRMTIKLIGPETLINVYVALGYELPRFALQVPLARVETLTLIHFQRLKEQIINVNDAGQDNCV